MAIVLIAEDEYLVRVGLRTCLDWERHGFILLDDAVNGEDAYQKILRHRPDILLLDIKMPRMDGFALLAKLREENIDVHVIILSGCDDFDSVRTALQYVARGETPFGVVYDTDAKVEPKVRIVGLFPDGTHPKIVYPAAVVAASKNPDAARFLAYMSSPPAAAIFRKDGFTVLPRR